MDIGPSLEINPTVIAMMLSILSPIIVCICIVATCFVNRDFNGLVFLGFAIAAYIIRNLVYIASGVKSSVAPDTGIAPVNEVVYSSRGNAFFSLYIFAFTIAYVTYPMIMSKNFNYIVFMGLLVYFMYDFVIKYMNNNYSTSSHSGTDFTSIFLNFLGGYTLGTLFPLFMYLGHSENFLLQFNSTPEKCSKDSSGKKYNCAVYQNGKLMGRLADD